MSAPAGPRSGGHAGHLELERLLFFSDAVFAIAITLLVLDLKVPERGAIRSAADLARALRPHAAQFFAFFVSFMVIGYYWYAHHVVFRYVRRWNERLIGINLVLLLCVAFVPWPVALFGAFHELSPVVALYTGTLAATGLVQAIRWWHAPRRRRLVDVDLHGDVVAYVYDRILVFPVMTGASTVLALFGTIATLWSLPLLLPLRLLRDRLAARARAAEGADQPPARPGARR